MKIIQLKSENVKRLHAVEIKPDGNMIVIGGKNGAGKSSVLDSIQWALGGQPDAKMPVRKGEEKAKIVADLGEIVVTRTITPTGGGTLVVRNADGVPQTSPQKILDALVGKLAFDPLEFSRQKPQQQAETLRALVGLDFKQHDADHEKVYNERTAVNRETSKLKAQMESMPKHDGAPERESSTSEVMAAQAEALKANTANEAKRRAAKDAADKVTAAENHLKELQRQAEEITKRIANGKAVIDSLQATAKTEQEAAANLTDLDVSIFAAKLKDVERINAMVRANSDRAKIVVEYKTKSSEAEKLTARLEALEQAKRKAINSAPYPIPGLAFDTAGGVVLNGIPFEQCSSAEQLKVSVAIGLALNPKLRVLLIHDGSLLDADSLAIVADMAKKADGQIWMERVSSGQEVSVVIEDGSVVAP
jgi:hypothetical protein